MNGHMLKTLMLVLVLPMAWHLEGHCGQKWLDGVVATVNGIPILHSEIEALIHQAGHSPGREHLDAAAAKNVLIEDALYQHECNVLFQDRDESDIQAHKRKIMQQQHMNEHEFKAALRAQGLTEKTFEERVKLQMCKSQLLKLKVANRVNVSNEDIKEAYQARFASKENNAKRNLIQLLLRPDETKRVNFAEDKAFMLSLKRKLRRQINGQSFIDSAKNATKTQKRLFVTELDGVGKGDLAFPELEKAVFIAQEGEIVGPIKTEAGWHLMVVEKREQSAPDSLEEMEKTLQEELWTEKYEEATQSFISRLRSAASITETDIEPNR
jgi:parvulin-like peptidyl-prolyl isomerase